MLDLDLLLAPITEQAPAGEDLSFSPEFDRIQEFRRADDPTLDQGEWQTEIKYADWPSVLKLCAELLEKRTKDLRVAGWLTEAAAHVEGFPGLAIGYRLMAELCRRYWDQVHPSPQDGDEEERVGNLAWLLSNSLQWQRSIPIVSATQGRFCLQDFDAAHARHGQDADDERLPGFERLEAARRDTSPDFYRQLLAVLPDCAEALASLEAAVDERLGIAGPSFTPAREQLDHLLRTVRRFARESGLLLEGETDDANLDASTAEPAPAMPPAASDQPRGPAGAPTSRKEALAQLRQVADFFRRTEPHSPVAYLAEKAARWGEMPLHVWLKRVIKDDSVLRQMEEMLDVAPDPDNQ